MQDTANIVSLVKGEEKYIFVYDDQSRAELLQVFGRFAGRKDLSFTWEDAVLVARRVTDCDRATT